MPYSCHHNIEKGDDGVSLGAYAKILFVLGMIERLVELSDPTFDTLGLGLDADNLPVFAFPEKQKEKSEWNRLFTSK